MPWSRAPGRRTAALTRLLAAEGPGRTLTRSELEEAFLAPCRGGGLPDPEVNVQLHGYEVDFLWREQNRVVEVDGFAFHSMRGASTATAARTWQLELAGFPVTRFTHDQVMYEPTETLTPHGSDSSRSIEASVRVRCLGTLLYLTA